jgi:hypothetical protein
LLPINIIQVPNTIAAFAFVMAIIFPRIVTKQSEISNLLPINMVHAVNGIENRSKETELARAHDKRDISQEIVTETQKQGSEQETALRWRKWAIAPRVSTKECKKDSNRAR